MQGEGGAVGRKDVERRRRRQCKGSEEGTEQKGREKWQERRDEERRAAETQVSREVHTTHWDGEAGKIQTRKTMEPEVKTLRAREQQ